MSFDLGKETSFSPPPPPKRRLSPWAVTGIGCAVLLVGSVIGIGIVVVSVSNNMKEEMKKPLNTQQILADLGDTPLYPKIKFDEQVSKAGRAGMLTLARFMPAKKVTIAGFRTDDSAAQVYSWYEEKLAAQGFRREEGRSNRGGHAYRKDNDMIIAQMNRSKSESNDKSEPNSMMLMRFDGMKQ